MPHRRPESADSQGTTEISAVDFHPVSSQPTPFSLQLVHGPGAPRHYRLDRQEIVLGRSSEADIQIESTDLSRKHLALRREHGQFSVHDLDSRNGVYLNGVRVHSATLFEGDNLQLGPVVLVFHEGRE